MRNCRECLAEIIEIIDDDIAECTDTLKKTPATSHMAARIDGERTALIRIKECLAEIISIRSMRGEK